MAAPVSAAAKAIFKPGRLGAVSLANRIIMAPMTRNRAVKGNAPAAGTEAVYYAQRASAGLIITEGTSPSADGIGYARMPGVFSETQIAGWKAVADAVHGKGGKIFMQIMHCGRIGAAANLLPGARLLAPSPIAAAGTMYTDSAGMQPHGTPVEMSAGDIASAVKDFAAAARNAVERAGFDGVEVHGANGYLVEQFLRPTTNKRSDGYGGDIAGRSRFLLEVVDATTAAIGVDRVGVRLSPFSGFNDTGIHEAMHDEYVTVAASLRGKVTYLHIVDHSSMGAPAVPDATKDAMKAAFKPAGSESASSSFILSGGYDVERAEADVSSGRADFIAVGRPLIANPDLVRRWETGAALNAPDFSTFYTPGHKGYTDYPALA